MRPMHVLSAAALLLAPAILGIAPAAAQVGGARIAIVDPAWNGTFDREDTVTVQYETWGAPVRLYATLDGAPIGEATTPNGTRAGNLTFATTVPAEVTSGARNLTVTMQGAGVPGSDTRRVTYVGGPAPNAPPSLNVTSARYDWAAEAVVVTGHASDPDGDAVDVHVWVENASRALLGVEGAWSASFPGAPPAQRDGIALATDGRDETTLLFRIEVPPRPPMPLTLRIPDAPLARGENASFEFRTDSGARSLAALVELDGRELATLLRPASGNTWQRVNYTVPPDAPLGPGTLVVRAWTERDASVRAERAVEVLHAAPRANVTNVTYDPVADEFVVTGFASDPEGAPVTLTLSSELGAATADADGGRFRLALPAVVSPGHATGADLVASDGDRATSLRVMLVAQNHAPVLAVTDVRYERGFGFHVQGEVVDPDNGVAAPVVQISTAWGGAPAIVENGTFRASFAALPRALGDTGVFAHAYDKMGGFASANATARVEGVFRVFYDETVNVSTGAHVEHQSFRVPPRVLGNVSMSETVPVVLDVGRPSRQVCTQSCGFVSVDGLAGDVLWGKAAGGANVRVTGYEV